MNEGTIKEIVGVVVDVAFGDDELPAIYNALEVSSEDRQGRYKTFQLSGKKINKSYRKRNFNKSPIKICKTALWNKK